MCQLERMVLIDNDEINKKKIPTEQDTAYVLNTFFSNIVTNFKIPEYTDYDPMTKTISDRILKLRNYSSTFNIREVCNKSQIFSFLNFHK